MLRDIEADIINVLTSSYLRLASNVFLKNELQLGDLHQCVSTVNLLK